MPPGKVIQTPSWAVPGSSIPVPRSLLDKNFFPRIQPETLLAQLEAVPSSSIASNAREEADSHLTTISFQAVVGGNKVSPGLPLLQTKQSQFPQPLLIKPVLQSPRQLCCSPLDMLRGLNVFLAVRSPKQMIISLLLLATLFPIQARMLLALATWTHCWLTFSQTSTSIPRSISSIKSSSHSAPSQ